ncbi:S8 family serine peptidase [Staphylococcus equorum]
MDYLGHGTEVAGVLKQISPWATITPYKIVDTGNASSINVIKAIRKAVDNGADIINLSLGTYKNLEKREDLEIVRIYKEAVLYAFNNNVVIVSSLGNRNLNLDYQLTNKNIVHLPSYFESVISVGSLNKINKLSSFTNYHEFKLFLLA